MPNKIMLLGTRKGLITYRQNGSGKWSFDDIQFLGAPVSIATFDPHTDTWWAMLDHGHWGCKLHRSNDGKEWEELEAPKYPEGEEIKDGVPATTSYLWAYTNDGNGQIYIGTVPGGLFRSKDNGSSFKLVRSLWDQPSRKDMWFGGGKDHPGIHSILVDPNDSKHIFIGISCAGVFETTDGCESWKVRNKGLQADFLPDPSIDIGHDPHLVAMCKANPKVLWQQNHCGIFRTENGGLDWLDIAQKDGPANFGFAVAAHEKDPNVAWVIPGISDEYRVAVDKALCVCRTDDGGKTWKDFRTGLPQSASFDIVYRHGMDITGSTLAFGTTTGNLYLSNNDGENWETLNNNLPLVNSLEFAEV